jgi:nucleoside-diphosphate-sugar epimerase
LEAAGVETIAADLLDPSTWDRLPDAPNVVYMAGMKFGTTGQESLTWAMNAYLPSLACRRYATSRIAAFSTGNVYGLSPVSRGGSREADSLHPSGEYAMSCLGRERIFEHFSRTASTPVTILRLNYANELRYGVLVDLAERVRDGRPVSVTMGYVNAIWQGDACAMSLQALEHAESPPRVLNIAGPERLRVRDVADALGRRMDRPVRFEGAESEDALLSDASESFALFGRPAVSVDQMLAWIAAWTSRGGASLGKPTHFEDRTGRF